MAEQVAVHVERSRLACAGSGVSGRALNSKGNIIGNTIDNTMDTIIDSVIDQMAARSQSAGRTRRHRPHPLPVPRARRLAEQPLAERHELRGLNENCTGLVQIVGQL